MRFMMLMYDDLSGVEPSPEEIEAETHWAAWDKSVAERGAAHRGIRLRPSAEAVTVRVRDGETLVTDGPFAETTELIAGYEIVECPDLDVAIEVAGGHPTTFTGTVEIRPFWEE
jgi:hypothetical protein